MKSTHPTALTPTPPSGSLFDTPLPQLLADLDVELVESSAIDDPTVTGYLVVRRDGHGVLAMPTGRPAFERDIAARVILAEAFDLPRPTLPSMLAASRV
jgi:hypothetical protein